MTTWRSLSAALALFALADHAPALAGVCAIEAGPPQIFSALVRGPATAEEVIAQTRIAMQKTGATLSPAYVNLPRIFAYYDIDGVRHGTIAAVTDGHMPNPGETVRLVARHRDPTQPCAFIPWTVVADVRAEAPANRQRREARRD